jgi:hypothetical protein
MTDALPLDYNRSFFWFTVNKDQMTRILIDARTFVTDHKSGRTWEFFLITPCKGEHMWRDDKMFQEPSFDFAGVFSREERVIYRTWVTHDPARKMEFDFGVNATYFDKTTFTLTPMTGARKMKDDHESYAAARADRVMACRTSVKSPDGRWSAVMEYPLKTVNLLMSKEQVQVDTGPLLLPTWAIPGWGDAMSERVIENLRMAFVVYNAPGVAEFSVRLPTETAPGAPKVWHYSRVIRIPAESTLFAV